MKVNETSQTERDYVVMENEITWLIENHVILNKIYEWDLESLGESSFMTEGMVSTSDKPLVHTLYDFTEMEKYPMNVAAVGKAVKPLLSSNKLGWVITVMDNPMILFLSTVATGLYGVRFRSFKTMNEALEFLQQRDSTLPPLV